MKRIILILLFILAAIAVYSQVNTEDVLSDEYLMLSEEKKSDYFRTGINESRFNTRLSMGSSFFSLGSSQYINTYFAPQVSYDFNPKLKLTVGSIATITHGNYSFSGVEGEMSKAQKIANYYMYAKGEYRLTDNLNLRASTLFDISPQSLDLRPSVHHIGFDLKLSDNASIHADFSIYNNTNPFHYNNPFYRRNDFFNSSSSFFGTSPF